MPRQKRNFLLKSIDNYTADAKEHQTDSSHWYGVIPRSLGQRSDQR